MEATRGFNVAYIANYQGEDLVSCRGVVRNRALAGSQKISLLSGTLTRAGCKVTVLSLGAVAERSLRFHGAFQSRIPGKWPAPVLYQAEWDIPLVGRAIGALGLLIALLRENRTRKMDVILLYNCGLPEAIVARMAAVYTHAPIVIEYEDDVFRGPDGRRSWHQYFQILGFRIVASGIRGVIAASPELVSRLNLSNSYVLRGMLADDLLGVRPVSDGDTRPARFLFAGSLQASKGVDKLCSAWVKAELPNCELHIVGSGPLSGSLRAAFDNQYNITFHGYVSRVRLVEMFNEAHVLVNPHCVAGEIGAVFPFKLIEYIGTGRPVISTPMAPLTDPLACGVFYSQSDSVEDLAWAMKHVHDNYRAWCDKARISREAAWSLYGPQTVSNSILRIIQQAIEEPKGLPVQ